VAAEDVRDDLAVEHVARDVGVVGRDLAPSRHTVLGGHADQAGELVRERLDRDDARAAAPHNRTTVRRPSPRPVGAMASLMRSSGKVAVTSSSSLRRPARYRRTSCGMSFRGRIAPSLQPRILVAESATSPGLTATVSSLAVMPTTTTVPPRRESPRP